MVFTWSALLNSLGLMGPMLLLAGFYGATVVGWYALVQRLLGVPITLLGRAVTNVYFSDSARLAREDPAELHVMFVSLLKKLALLGSVTIIPAGLISPYAFPIIFGDNWDVAGQYALVLSPMILLQFVSSPFGVTLTVLQRQDLALLRETVRVVFLMSAILVVGLRGLASEKAVLALSVAGAATYIVHIFISWIAIQSLIRKRNAL